MLCSVSTCVDRCVLEICMFFLPMEILQTSETCMSTACQRSKSTQVKAATIQRLERNRRVEFLVCDAMLIASPVVFQNRLMEQCQQPSCWLSIAGRHTTSHYHLHRGGIIIAFTWCSGFTLALHSNGFFKRWNLANSIRSPTHVYVFMYTADRRSMCLPKTCERLSCSTLSFGRSMFVVWSWNPCDQLRMYTGALIHCRFKMYQAYTKLPCASWEKRPIFATGSGILTWRVGGWYKFNSIHMIWESRKRSL